MLTYSRTHGYAWATFVAKEEATSEKDAVSRPKFNILLTRHGDRTLFWNSFDAAFPAGSIVILGSLILKVGGEDPTAIRLQTEAEQLRPPFWCQDAKATLFLADVIDWERTLPLALKFAEKGRCASKGLQLGEVSCTCTGYIPPRLQLYMYKNLGCPILRTGGSFGDIGTLPVRHGIIHRGVSLCMWASLRACESFRTYSISTLW